MAINERLIDTEVAAAGNGGAADAEQGLILHLDANDVDSYDGDGSVWYDISTHDLTVPLSDNASNLKCHLNFSDSTSYSGTGTTVTDISDESNDFTFSGITESDFDKDNGGYVDLDGTTDYLERSSTISGHFDSDYSLDLWVNPHENNNFTYFYCKQSASTNGLLVGNFAGSTGQLEVYRYNTSGSASSTAFSGTGVTANQWNHVVIVFSGSNCIIYVNGEQKVTSSSFSGTYPADFTNFRIGGGYNSGYDLDGELGTFRLYDKALSASEVGQNYRHGRDYIYTDLIADTDLELHLDAGNTDSYDPDTDTTTWSDLVGSNNATFTSMGVANHDKEIGGWFEFDGSSDYGTISYNSSIYMTSNTGFAIEAWVNRDDDSEGYLISSADSSTFPYALQWNSTTHGWYGWISGSSYGGVAGLNENTTLGTGKWEHVVLTQSSSDRKNRLYVNGVLTSTSSAVTGFHSTSSDVYIGAYHNLANKFDGKIGQVRIYQAGLSADEVLQNYVATKNNYPNGINASLTNVSWTADYFEMDSTSDLIEFDNGLKSYLDGLTTALSTSYWVRFDDLDGSQNLFSYYNSSLGGDSASFSQAMLASGKLQWVVFPTSGTTYPRTTSVCVTANTWHHIVMVLDMSKPQTNGTGGRVQIFVDGTEQSITYIETTGGTTLKTASASLKPHFGFTTGSSGVKEQFFDGRVSKIKIFDKALTQAEVTALEAEGSGN